MTSHLFAISLTIGTVAFAMGADLPVLKVESQVASRRCEVTILRSDQVGSRTDYWGTDGAVPSHIVKDVHISVDGMKCPCPREAFQDLAEVQYDSQVVFDHGETDGSLVVVIRGGDGAGAYSARISLVDRRVVKRDMMSAGGFVTETTTWREGVVASRVYTNTYGSEKSKP
jgi:hypothetical protein